MSFQHLIRSVKGKVEIKRKKEKERGKREEGRVREVERSCVFWSGMEKSRKKLLDLRHNFNKIIGDNVNM